MAAHQPHQMIDAFSGDSPDPASAFTAALSVEWKDRPRFVVLDDRFNGGSRFLRCLQAWRADLHRCAQLHVITISSDITDGLFAHPLAEEIGSAWPPITPNVHRLAFEGGQVQWLLLPMGLRAGLRELVSAVDAFAIGPSAESDATGSQRQAKALARLARVGGMTWIDAASTTDVGAMRSAGFTRQDGSGERWR